MKIKIVLTLLLVTVLFACNPNDNRSSIPGTYVHNGTGTYSVASDTMVIQESGKNMFTIQRRTGYNLIRDGKKGKREHEIEDWNVVWDEKTGMLTETQREKILVFYPDSNILVIGKRRYKKVN